MSAEAGTLDEAWAAAEAALPEGWSMGSLIAGVSFGPGFLVRTTEWRATAYSLDLKRKPEGMGPTPAAALLALAAGLLAEPNGLGLTDAQARAIGQKITRLTRRKPAP